MSVPCSKCGKDSAMAVFACVTCWDETKAKLERIAVLEKALREMMYDPMNQEKMVERAEGFGGGEVKIQFGEPAVFRELEPGDVFTMPRAQQSVCVKLLKAMDEKEAAADLHDAVDLASGMRIPVPAGEDVVVYRKATLTL